MYGTISLAELQTALNALLKQAQIQHFQEEITDLVRGQHIRTTGKLRALTPFIDATGVLRVGGRLRHADVSYDERHPIILVTDDLITRLIID